MKARKALSEAAAGLLYPSESDAPLTLYTWPDADREPSPEALLAALGKPADTAVETITVDDLLRPFCTPPRSPSEEDVAEAKRFTELVAVIGRELDKTRVYRVGEVDIDVYLLGCHASGAWLGLKTHAVET